MSQGEKLQGEMSLREKCRTILTFACVYNFCFYGNSCLYLSPFDNVFGLRIFDIMKKNTFRAIFSLSVNCVLSLSLG